VSATTLPRCWLTALRIRERKRARVGASTLPGDRQHAAFPNHVWALISSSIKEQMPASWNDSSAFTEHRCLFAWITPAEMTANALPDWCAVHWNRSRLLRTSDRHGKTPTWNHSTAKSAMNDLPLKSSQPCSKPRSWLKISASTTTRTDPTWH
jgi:hypothetical protein